MDIDGNVKGLSVLIAPDIRSFSDIRLFGQVPNAYFVSNNF